MIDAIDIAKEGGTLPDFKNKLKTEERRAGTKEIRQNQKQKFKIDFDWVALVIVIESVEEKFQHQQQYHSVFIFLYDIYSKKTSTEDLLQNFCKITYAYWKHRCVSNMQEYNI